MARQRVPLKAIQLFHAGTHKAGTDEEATYTAADLAAMVRNFRTFSEAECLVPPVGIGHENEAEALFGRTDVLGWGEVVKLWTEKGATDEGPTTFLVGDLAVDPDIAAWVKNGNLTRVSAEIYDSPPEGCQGKGRTLKRVALLGFELPQLKGLKPLTAAHHADGRSACATRACATGRGRGIFTVRTTGTKRLGNVACVFSEARYAENAMTREQMMSMLADSGYSSEFLDALTDEQLGALILEVQRMTGGGGGAAEPAAATAAEVDGVDMSREDIIAELTTTFGMDAAELESMTDEELAALLSEQRAGATALSETPAMPTTLPAASAPLVTSAAAALAPARQVAVPQFAEVRKLVRRAVAVETRSLKRAVAVAKKERDHEAAQAKRARVHAFCEQMLAEKRITPADLDETDPNTLSLEQQLLALDSVRVVRTYAEGGTTKRLTALDMAMERVRKQAPRRYGEKVPQGGDNGKVSVERAQSILAGSIRGRAILKDLKRQEK